MAKSRWSRIFDAVDRNRQWKIYRHITAFITLLKTFGLWPDSWSSAHLLLLGGGAIGVGSIVGIVADLPLGQKLLAGIACAALIPSSVLAVIATFKLSRPPVLAAEGKDASGEHPEPEASDPRNWSPLRQQWEAFKGIKKVMQEPPEKIPEAFVRNVLAQQYGIRPEDVTMKQIRFEVAGLLKDYPHIELVPFQPQIEDAKRETRGDVNPKRPTLILKSIMARLSTFELTARDFDAFEIEIHPLTCKDAVIGWNLPKTVLLSGETMPATICEIGKSGAYYNHAAPLLLEQALDRLTSPDSPVAETSILITYRDAERQQWQNESPIRYDRRLGKAEFLVPTFSLRNALPVTVDSKTDSTPDQDTFETFRNHLPSNQIAHLRLRDQIFSWDTSADAALATFIRRNAGTENAFLDESLERLRVKLHERIKILLDRAYRYTDDAPDGKARRFTYEKNDTATYDKNRDEVINLTQDVVSTYDALILAARKQFAGGRD